MTGVQTCALPIYGDIVEVLATLSARIVGIPTGCYGSKYLHVVFVVARVEDKCIHIAQLYRLEERIVSACLHWLLEDVVGFDVLFVSLEHAAYDGFDRIFFNDTATTEIYTLSLHDALPICICCRSNQLGYLLSWR